MRVSCIIPAYNEAARIAAVVEAARACPHVDEVIVVDDGSTDATAARAFAAGAHQVISLPRNEGKGGAVLAALPHARGEVLVLLDADLRGLQPAHLARLVAPVIGGGADMSVGVFTDDPWHSRLRRLSGQRALRRGLLRQPDDLAATGFGLELALDHLARTQRARVAEVPLAGVTHRRKRQKYGTVRGLRQEVRASSDLFRQARQALAAPSPAPPRRHRHQPRAEKERRRPMPLAVLLLVVLLLIILPVFLAPPSHAAHVTAIAPVVPGDRLLLVVAHPDDEIIGAGGLLATARRAAIPVSVLVLTNGDSNRLSAALVGRHLRLRAGDFIRVGQVRQRETQEALRRVDVPADDVIFLGFPDRTLPRVVTSPTPVTSPFTRLSRAAYPDVLDVDATYTGEALRTLVARVIARVRPTVIITHAPFDVHSDHQATYALVRPLVGEARLYTFLVHAAGFPRPLRFAPREELRPPAALAAPPGWTWVEFPLSPDAQRDKHRALNAHRSQLETPYLRLLLTGFVRTNELFAIPRPVSEPFGTPR
jgi:LmbE family N-acetylglucosaminyl deacetylase